MNVEVLLPVIEVDKCTGCDLCVDVCLENALFIKNNVVAPIEGVECDYCGECEAICPSGAITCPYDIVVEQRN